MRFTAPALVLFSTLVLAVSCGPGQLTYQDKVRPLPDDQAHPAVVDLIPLMEAPGARDVDDLARTWKEFTARDPLPLRQENNVTFVYYDFTKKLSAVYLEASFAPGRKEPLTRVGQSALFYRVYEIPRPQVLKYRFSNGSQPLADPFRNEVYAGGDQWHGPSDPTQPRLESVVGASEAGLAGLDVSVQVPPGYDRNLGWTYPLVLLVGITGDQWTNEAAALYQATTINPVVLVAVAPKASGLWTETELKATLEEKVVPWARSRYRVSTLAADLYLTGWGVTEPVVKAVAVARPEFWTKFWPLVDGGLAPFLKVQFPVVNP
jgi:hypothetical protein